jgi:hypothetical protein
VAGARLMAPCIGVLLVACGSGVTTSTAGLVDPCGLISVDQMSAATGGSLSGAPVSSVSADGVLCTYTLTGSGATRATVEVLQRQPDEVQAFRDNKAHPRDGSPITPVAGLGDDAFFDVADELWVLKGNRTLVVGVDGSEQPLHDLEVKLATIALIGLSPQ